MTLEKIITGAVFAGLVGVGIFGCSQNPMENKKGVIVKEWVDASRDYNASVRLISDTGMAWVKHNTEYMTPVLDSLFNTGDTVTITKRGYYSEGLEYYHLVK